MSEDQVLDAAVGLLSGQPQPYKRGVLDLVAKLIYPEMTPWATRRIIEARLAGRKWIGTP
jgi:hypothetical protein